MTLTRAFVTTSVFFVSSNGDTVIVATGTYVTNINFNGKNIVLRSTDPLDPTIVAKTIIDGNQAGSVVSFSGTETEACVLSGFTIRNGAASNGGGICGGTLSVHTQAQIEDNVITGSTAVEYGGGLCYCDGTIYHNTITGNSADVGGGVDYCGGTMQNNTIVGNSARVAGGGLNNCNGTIENNTITANSAGEYGGGGLFHCGGAIRNCIIWGNTAPGDPQLGAPSIPTFSCIEGWSGGGQGNIAPPSAGFVNPEAHDYHLQEGSPCIDAGANYYWFTWPQRDLDGNCRLVRHAVDMGCYEYGSSPDADGDLLSDSDESPAGTDPLDEDSDGDGLRDGLELLRGSNPLQPTPPGILNVPSDIPTIQESLCVCMAGDEIIVGPGTYPENLQFCGPDVILRGSDPGDPNVVASTILDGGAAGPVVCFMGGESESCVLAGFTIRNGKAYDGGGIRGGTHYGVHTHATIQNNAISGNSAQYGGGVALCDGRIQNNTMTGNSAGEYGGGLYDCRRTIQNNTIAGNSARLGGGGLCNCDGTIQNNTITGNSAAEIGGGLCGCNGTMRNNTITGNSAGDYGGGVHYCNGTICNCIIWANTAPISPQLHESSEPTYSCIQDWSGGGEGNTLLDPQLVDPDGPDNDPGTYEDNDYRLSAGSPCIDAGMNQDWMWTATDLDGNPRIVHGGLSLTVDMGAYEYGSWSFRIIQVLVEATGGLQLTWNSSPSVVVYIIWSCTNVTSEDWTAEGTVSSAGASTSWTDPSPTGSQKFYRIQQL